MHFKNCCAFFLRPASGITSYAPSVVSVQCWESNVEGEGLLQDADCDVVVVIVVRVVVFVNIPIEVRRLSVFTVVSPQPPVGEVFHASRIHVHVLNICSRLRIMHAVSRGRHVLVGEEASAAFENPTVRVLNLDDGEPLGRVLDVLSSEEEGDERGARGRGRRGAGRGAQTRYTYYNEKLQTAVPHANHLMRYEVLRIHRPGGQRLLCMLRRYSKTRLYDARLFHVRARPKSGRYRV